MRAARKPNRMLQDSSWASSSTSILPSLFRLSPGFGKKTNLAFIDSFAAMFMISVSVLCCWRLNSSILRAAVPRQYICGRTVTLWRSRGSRTEAGSCETHPGPGQHHRPCPSFWWFRQVTYSPGEYFIRKLSYYFAPHSSNLWRNQLQLHSYDSTI